MEQVQCTLPYTYIYLIAFALVQWVHNEYIYTLYNEYTMSHCTMSTQWVHLHIHLHLYNEYTMSTFTLVQWVHWHAGTWYTHMYMDQHTHVYMYQYTYVHGPTYTCVHVSIWVLEIIPHCTTCVHVSIYTRVYYTHEYVCLQCRICCHSEHLRTTHKYNITPYMYMLYTRVCMFTMSNLVLFQAPMYSQLQKGRHWILRLFLKTFNLVPGVPGFSWDVPFITWY